MLSQICLSHCISGTTTAEYKQTHLTFILMLSWKWLWHFCYVKPRHDDDDDDAKKNKKWHSSQQQKLPLNSLFSGLHILQVYYSFIVMFSKLPHLWDKRCLAPVNIQLILKQNSINMILYSRQNICQQLNLIKCNIMLSSVQTCLYNNLISKKQNHVVSITGIIQVLYKS